MSEQLNEPAPYALLLLTGLRVVRFLTKDEWLDAIRMLQQNNTPYIALKYHAVTDCYAPQEEW